MSKWMQIKILKDRPTMFRVGGNDKWVGDCSPLFYVVMGMYKPFKFWGGQMHCWPPQTKIWGGQCPSFLQAADPMVFTSYQVSTSRTTCPMWIAHRIGGRDPKVFVNWCRCVALRCHSLVLKECRSEHVSNRRLQRPMDLKVVSSPVYGDTARRHTSAESALMPYCTLTRSVSVQFTFRINWGRDRFMSRIYVAWS